MNVRLHFLARAWNMKSERNKTTVNTLNCAAFRPSKLFHHLEQQWNHFILKWLKASLHDNVVTAKNKLWRLLPSIPLDLYLRLVFVLMLRMSYNIFIFTKQQIYWTFQSSLSKQLKRVLQWVPMLTQYLHTVSLLLSYFALPVCPFSQATQISSQSQGCTVHTPYSLQHLERVRRGMSQCHSVLKPLHPKPVPSFTAGLNRLVSRSSEAEKYWLLPQAPESPLVPCPKGLSSAIILVVTKVLK